MPKIMARFGNYRTVSSLIILAAFLLLGLSYFKDFIYLAPIFVGLSVNYPAYYRMS